MTQTVTPDGAERIRRILLAYFRPSHCDSLSPDVIRRILRRAVRELRARGTTIGETPAGFSGRFRDVSIPSEPGSLWSYLKYVVEAVVPASANMGSPLCMAHMTGPVPDFIPPLAELVASLNQNLVKRESSQCLSLVERQVTGMLHHLVYGLPQPFYERHVQSPESVLGVAASGGSLANLTALWIARNALLGPAPGFAGVEQAGLPAALARYGYRNAVVLCSRLVHYSVEKAATLLGLGTQNVVQVPVDGRRKVDVGRMRELALRCRAEGCAVLAMVGVAGATDCGTIDPLADLADLAAELKVHLHVDAAWGAPLLFSQRHKDKLAGIERADSVTVDAHKQLFLPVGISLLLLRNPWQASVIRMAARYMLRDDSGDLGRYSVEGSRPGTALLLHAALHLFGVEGYATLIDDNLQRAQTLARRIDERPEFELLTFPETNVVLYRYLPERLRLRWRQEGLTRQDQREIDAINKSLQRAQAEAGRALVSRTTLYGVPCQDGHSDVVALRAIVSNPISCLADHETLLDDQVRFARELEVLCAHPTSAGA